MLYFWKAWNSRISIIQMWNKQINKYTNTNAKIKVLKRPNMCSSTTLTPCWPSSSGMESGRGQLVHQQHHPASFCWLGRVWQQGREKSGASTLREVLFSKADSPSWWPDEDLKQLTWKSFPGNDNIQFYIHHFSFPKFSFCAFWNFHSVLDKESQELKVLVPNKFRSKTSLWLQWRDKFQR